MTDTSPQKSPLRRPMIEDMTVRNLSPATQRSYIHAVKKFSRYFNRSPDRLGLEDVHAFQVHLVTHGISWPALNQTVCALRFFYGITLGSAEIPERIAYASKPRKLPADNLNFVNGVLWVLPSGAHWHDLPKRYGKWKTVHKRFTRWAKAGVRERVFEHLIRDPDNAYVSLDSSLVRAHQQAATGKGGGQKGGTRLWGVPEED